MGLTKLNIIQRVWLFISIGTENMPRNKIEIQDKNLLSREKKSRQLCNQCNKDEFLEQEEITEGQEAHCTIN